MASPESDRLPHIELFTDGACSGNPGPGGWACIVRHLASGKEQELSGGEAKTTNNRMEMMSIIEGLAVLEERCRVELFSDSKYVVNGLTEWLANWKKNGWRNSARKPVKNKELWLRLDELAGQHDLTCHWVKGHDDHPENERCDQLAVAARERYQ